MTLIDVFRNIVHHLWCYDNMKDRELARRQLWQYEQWTTHVRNTVSNSYMVPRPLTRIPQ